MINNLSLFLKYCQKNYLRGVTNILYGIKDPERKNSYITTECPDRGYSALFIAVSKNRLKLLKILKENLTIQEKDTSTENLTNNNRNLLIHAIEKGHTKIFLYLLKQENLLLQKDKNSPSLMVTAVKHGRTEIIKHLLSQSPEITQKLLTETENSFTALMMASCKNLPQIAELILEKAGNFKYHLMSQFNKNGSTPLISAVKQGHFKMVQTILKHCTTNKRSIYQEDRNGQSALMHAAKNNHPEIAEEILKNSSYLKEHLIQQLNHNACNALMVAANFGHFEVAEILLKNCKNKERLIFQTTIFGSSAIHFAAEEGHHEIVRLILNHCSKTQAERLVTLKDQDSNSPMLLASETKNSHVVKILQSRASTQQETQSHFI